jgi:hypothetical protein
MWNVYRIDRETDGNSNGIIAADGSECVEDGTRAPAFLLWSTRSCFHPLVHERKICWSIASL